MRVLSLAHWDRPLRRSALLIGLAALLVGGYVAAAGGGFPLDDSWIHQTYGRNLAQRSEWAFVPGQPSAASTSPLYTVVLAAGYALGVPYALWTHGMGVLTLAAVALLGASLAQAAAPTMRHAPLVTALALSLTWHLIWAAASGMETLLFGALTLLIIRLAWRVVPAAPRAGMMQGALFGGAAALAMLARPEGIVLAGMAGLLVVLRAWPQRVGVAAWIVGAAAGFGLLSAPYLLLNYQLTGGLLPNTASAKFEQHAVLLALPYPQRVFDLLVALLPGGQAVLLVGCIGYLRATAQRRPLLTVLLYWLPLLWAVALIALYAARLPAAYQHGRYVIPALPALVVMGAVGIAQWVQQVRRGLLARVLVRALALAAALLLLGFALFAGPQIYSTDVAIIDGEMVAAAQWVRANLPPADLLALHDIGAVGYFAPRPLLDIAGLISPEVIPIVADAEALWALLQARDARYLLGFPDQLPGDDPADSRLCPIYTTNAAVTQRVGQPNMTLYRLVWSGDCPR